MPVYNIPQPDEHRDRFIQKDVTAERRLEMQRQAQIDNAIQSGLQLAGSVLSEIDATRQRDKARKANRAGGDFARFSAQLDAERARDFEETDEFGAPAILGGDYSAENVAGVVRSYEERRQAAYEAAFGGLSEDDRAMVDGKLLPNQIQAEAEMELKLLRVAKQAEDGRTLTDIGGLISTMSPEQLVEANKTGGLFDEQDWNDPAAMQPKLRDMVASKAFTDFNTMVATGDPATMALALEQADATLKLVKPEQRQAVLNQARGAALGMLNGVEEMTKAIEGNPADAQGTALELQDALTRAAPLVAKWAPGSTWKLQGIAGAANQQLEITERAMEVAATPGTAPLKRTAGTVRAAQLRAGSLDDMALSGALRGQQLTDALVAHLVRFPYADTMPKAAFSMLPDLDPAQQSALDDRLATMPQGIGRLFAQGRAGAFTEVGRASRQGSVGRAGDTLDTTDDDVGRQLSGMTVRQRETAEFELDLAISEIETQFETAETEDLDMRGKVRLLARVQAAKFLEGKGIEDDANKRLARDLALRAEERILAGISEWSQFDPTVRARRSMKSIVSDQIAIVNPYQIDPLTGSAVGGEPVIAQSPEIMERIQEEVFRDRDFARELAGELAPGAENPDLRDLLKMERPRDGVSFDMSIPAPKVVSADVVGMGESEGSRLVQVWLEGADGEPVELPKLIELGPEAERAHQNSATRWSRELPRTSEDQPRRFASTPDAAPNTTVSGGPFSTPSVSVNPKRRVQDADLADEAAKVRAAAERMQALDARHHAGLVSLMGEKGVLKKDLQRLMELDALDAIPSRLGGELLVSLRDMEDELDMAEERLRRESTHQPHIEAVVAEFDLQRQAIVDLRRSAKTLQLSHIRDKALLGANAGAAPSAAFDELEVWDNEEGIRLLEEMIGYLNMSEPEITAWDWNPIDIRTLVLENWKGSPERELWITLPPEKRMKHLVPPRGMKIGGPTSP